MADYLLPFFMDEINEYDNDNAIPRSEDQIYTDISWDYENNKPILINGDFVVVRGIEAVRSWAFRTLQTQRYRFGIFTWNHGLDISRFKGKILTDKNKVDLIKEIKECLLQNKAIKNIYDFNFSTDKNDVIINFKVNTDYGEYSEEVKLDGKH